MSGPRIMPQHKGRNNSISRQGQPDEVNETLAAVARDKKISKAPHQSCAARALRSAIPISSCLLVIDIGYFGESSVWLGLLCNLRNSFISRSASADFPSLR